MHAACSDVHTATRSYATATATATCHRNHSTRDVCIDLGSIANVRTNENLGSNSDSDANPIGVSRLRDHCLDIAAAAGEVRCGRGCKQHYVW